MSHYEKSVFFDSEFSACLRPDIRSCEKPYYAHWHEFLEFLYFVEGACTINCDGIPQVMKDGELLFINSNCIHNILPHSPGCHYLILTVDADFFRQCGVHTSGRASALKITDPHITSLLLEMDTLQKEKPNFYKKEMMTLMKLLLIRLDRLLDNHQAPPIRRSKHHQVVINGVEFLNEHFSEQITLEMISAHVGCSKYHFSRLFKKIMGQTITEYLNYQRCNYARKLLAEGNHNVSESAVLSGFQSLSYFTKVYKKHIGVVPSQSPTSE